MTAPHADRDQSERPGHATHVDRDGDFWRITPGGALLWSHHQHKWVEARGVLDVVHRAHGPDWLRPVRPVNHTKESTR